MRTLTRMHTTHKHAHTYTHTHTNRLITILRKTNDEIDKNTSRHKNNALIFARGLKAPPRLWIDITTLGSQILITIPSGTALSVTMWKTSIFPNYFVLSKNAPASQRTCKAHLKSAIVLSSQSKPDNFSRTIWKTFIFPNYFFSKNALQAKEHAKHT